MIEKESLTHRIEDDMERRNRNWDIINAHLRNYTEQVGNPANLTTVSKEVVGAVNELKDEIDTNKEELTQHKQDYAQQRSQDQLKVATVEKELNDYKKTLQQVNVNQEPRQSASGYGTVSLPKNAANGQVSASVRGLTINNLLGEKGDCENPNDFSVKVAYTDAITENGRMKITIPSAGSAYRGIPIALDSSKHYFIRGTIANGNLSSGIIFRVKNSNGYIGDETFYKKTININKGIKIQPSNITENMSVGVFILSNDKQYGYVDNIAVYEINEDEYNNMTEEELLQKYTYINGTKSTVSATRIKSVGKNLFDKRIGFKISDYIIDFGNSDRAIPIKLKPNTTYTISRYQNEWVYDASFILSLKDGLKQNLMLISNYSKVDPKTFTTDSEGVIYLVRRYGTNETLNNILNTVQIQIEQGDTATPYEPYKESTAYVIAKDKDNKIVNLMSHEGVHDEIDLDKRELIKRIGVDEEGLTYQLAKPEIIPIQVSGNIVSNPSGTVYFENAVADAGVYNNGISIFEQELDIDHIDKLSKVEYETGVETELDANKAIISEDKKSFTHPDLTNGDMVFFSYFYSNESTQGEATVEYYDSRYAIKDKSLDKFYQWGIEVDNGVPSIKLVEV